MHWVIGLLGLWCWGLGCARPPGSPGTVLPGIDVLLSDRTQLVRGRRVGLLTNQAGVDSRGVRDVDRLIAAGIDVAALFSPEHGFQGTVAPGSAVDFATDSATGLPIYSLYGRNSSPIDTVLAGVDLLLVDLQDSGARYYTYLATLVDVMRAGARADNPVGVLDRPDPVGGVAQGNVLDPAFSSTVGLLAVPMRHGMTLGELARLAQADLKLTTRLTVVPAAGWRRAMYFEDTGLPFIPPSPNLRSIESLFHYPGLCLFEGTALSVDRGSEAPFEQIGASWLDTAAVLAGLRAARLPGVRFQATRFTPRRPGDGKFADTVLTGIRLRVVDRAAYDPTATAVTLLSLIQARHPDRIGWRDEWFDRLAGGSGLRLAIQAGKPAEEIVRGWRDDLTKFQDRRRSFLLYGP